MSIEQKMHYQMQLEEANKKKKKALIAVCTLGLSQTPLLENIRDADETKKKMSFGDTPLGLVFGIAWFLFWTLLTMAILWVINIIKLIVHAIHCNELKKLIDAEQEQLNSYQKAFVYAYDDSIWGEDRAFFAEETLFYPYSGYSTVLPSESACLNSKGWRQE